MGDRSPNSAKGPVARVTTWKPRKTGEGSGDTHGPMNGSDGETLRLGWLRRTRPFRQSWVPAAAPAQLLRRIPTEWAPAQGGRRPAFSPKPTGATGPLPRDNMV